MIFSNLKWRSIYLIAGIGTFLFVYYLGATYQMTFEDAKSVSQQLGTKNKNLDQNSIFINNIKPAFGMFVPGFGVGLGIYSAYSTGLAFSAAAALSPLLRGISPLVVFTAPFAIMELFSYGLAMSRSGLLVYQLLKRRNLWRDYALRTAIEIGIVTVLLLIGSVVEWQVIQQRQHLANR